MTGINIAGRAAAADNSPPYVVVETVSLGGNFNIWRVLNGTPTRLTPYTDPAGVSPPYSETMGNPRLSPDGQWVAYQELWPGLGGGAVIDLVPGAGGSVTRLFDDEFGDYAMYPSWHPDSDLLVFVHGPGATGGGEREGSVKTLTVPGGTETELWVPAETNEGAYRPKYSPDGTKIAFLVNLAPGGADETRQGLWVMDADGSNDTLIRAYSTTVTNGGYTFASDGPHLAWSNDGEWIAFVDAWINSSATFNLYKIRPDGTDETLLATGRPPSSRVWRLAEDAWAPDDSFLIALLDGSGWGIHQVAADGSGTTEIVDGSTHAVGTQIVREPSNNRIYWKTSPAANDIRSSAFDGSDVRVDHDTTSIAGSWGAGEGFYIDVV